MTTGGVDALRPIVHVPAPWTGPIGSIGRSKLQVRQRSEGVEEGGVHPHGIRLIEKATEAGKCLRRAMLQLVEFGEAALQVAARVDVAMVDAETKSLMQGLLCLGPPALCCPESGDEAEKPAWILRVASMPFNPGILMSITMTSGCALGQGHHFLPAQGRDRPGGPDRVMSSAWVCSF